MQQKISNGVNVLPLLRILSSKDLAGKRVLLRADFDVAVKNGRIQDYSRINTNIPTIKFILRAGGYIRIVTHLGRPHGKVIPSLSMKKIAIQLGRMLRRKIIFLRNPYDRRSFKAYNNSPEIIFFENIRFWPGEEKNSPSFAKKLSAWGDLYVNECFATSHRKHASFVAVAHALPAFAGCYLEKEIFYLDKVLVNPRWPVVTVLGGSKLETKLPLVEVFLKKQYDVLVGGAIANTLLAARNVSVGQSLVEHDYFERVRNVLFNPRLHLPCRGSRDGCDCDSDCSFDAVPESRGRAEFLRNRTVGSGAAVRAVVRRARDPDTAYRSDVPRWSHGPARGEWVVHTVSDCGSRHH